MGKDPALPSCGVGRRRVLDPTLLWLWCRLAAVALVRPLAWELSYATGAAQERKEKKKKRISPQDNPQIKKHHHSIQFNSNPIFLQAYLMSLSR